MNLVTLQGPIEDTKFKSFDDGQPALYGRIRFNRQKKKDMMIGVAAFGKIAEGLKDIGDCPITIYGSLDVQNNSKPRIIINRYEKLM